MHGERVTFCKEQIVFYAETSFFFLSFLLLCIRLYVFILLFNSLCYFFLLLCLCILIVMYALFLYSLFIVPTGTLRLPWLRFFRAFSSVVRQMPGYKSHRWGTARTLPNWLIVLFYVLYVCKCVLYYCHRVTTQLQLTNMSYQIVLITPRTENMIIYSELTPPHSTLYSHTKHMLPHNHDGW